MSDVQSVMDYVMKTPHNTNSEILRQQLEGLRAGGSGNNQSLYGLPYKCHLAYAGEIEPEFDEYGNTKEIILQMDTGLYPDEPFIVFCGDKINDNKKEDVLASSFLLSYIFNKISYSVPNNFFNNLGIRLET